MGANSNTFDSDIVVPSLADLPLVWVAPLDDGSECWVIDEDARWVLRKNSGLAPDVGVGFPFGQFIVTPAPGSPIAGLPNARWIKEVSCGLNQSTSVELNESFSIISTVFTPIPTMSIALATAPAPVGGILLIDFSGVFLLAPSGQSPATFGEVNVELLVDGVQQALASYSEEFGDFEAVDTISITKRLDLSATPGNHIISLRWKVNLGAVATTAGLAGPPVNRFYNSLRVVEVGC